MDSPHLKYTLIYMGKDLHRRLMPHPKGSGTLATALPAAPAPFPVVHMQVLRGERMPFTTRVREASLPLADDLRSQAARKTRPGTAADTVIDEALDLTDLVYPNHIRNNGVAALLQLRGD